MKNLSGMILGTKPLRAACLSLLLGYSLSVGGAHAAEDCSNVSIVSMNWQSGELLAALDKFILEQGYGCQAEVISGDPVILSTSMVEKGTPDIVPEGWFNQMPAIVKESLDKGELIGAADVFEEGAVHGLWIPKYTAEAHPEIKTVEDALRRPDLFPNMEDSSKGALHNGPTSWFLTTIVSQLFKAYGGEDAGFVLVDPGSAAGLDGSLIRAYERGENWFGYYWLPSSMLGKYEMVKLDFGVAYDAAEWARCTIDIDCPDPKRTDWPADRVLTVVTRDFAARAGEEVMTYLNTRSWDNVTINTLLAWMSDTQATGEEATLHFLRTYETVWVKWVSPQAAEKIKAAL